MSSAPTLCEKHQIRHHFYGGVSRKRCHECERDAQLDRIERMLSEVLLFLRT